MTTVSTPPAATREALGPTLIKLAQDGLPIVVVDAERKYVTEWGGTGSGPGEFDFGPGTGSGTTRDLAGSVAVDDEGFIYVADVGNQRIQKFAP